MTLADRVAIVTGAGTCIGRAVALALAQAGAHVVAVDIDGKLAGATAATAGGRSLGLEVDVGDLGAGIGIATGYATLGLMGFESRQDYAAIGTVTNLAARLCGEATHTEILLSQRVAGAVENLVTLEALGPLALKGFARPVPAFRVLTSKTA